MAAREDAVNQAIPTMWVVEANKRWSAMIPEGIPMCAIGVDASGGGNDPMVIAPRHDCWFAPLIQIEGRKIPPDAMGKYCAAAVIANRRDLATVVLDMGGGYGGPMWEHFKENNVEAVAYRGAGKSLARTKDRQLGFYNVRSQAYWQFREALDPDQDGGSPIALPENPSLLADLTALTFEVGSRGIKVESKEKVCDRLRRSTDDGDAVVMSWYGGLKRLAPGRFRHRNSKPEIISKKSKRGQRTRRR